MVCVLYMSGQRTASSSEGAGECATCRSWDRTQISGLAEVPLATELSSWPTRKCFVQSFIMSRTSLLSQLSLKCHRLPG